MIWFKHLFQSYYLLFICASNSLVVNDQSLDLRGWSQLIEQCQLWNTMNFQTEFKNMLRTAWDWFFTKYPIYKNGNQHETEKHRFFYAGFYCRKNLRLAGDYVKSCTEKRAGRLFFVIEPIKSLICGVVVVVDVVIF